MARLTDSEITEMIVGLPDWSVLEEDGMKRLNREFSFDDFASALEFTNRVGDLAEESNHHPRSEEHTSELQSLVNLVCRLLLDKKKKNTY